MYTSPSNPVNGSPCSTDETDYALFLTGFYQTFDAGTVSTAPDGYHGIYTQTQIAQAYSPNGGTSITGAQAGTAIIGCSHTTGCGTVTITLPPFTVSSGNTVETGVFTYNDTCPGKVYQIDRNGGGGGGCTCKSCGCGSPLVMNLDGRGPFQPGSANIVYHDVEQFTDLDHGIDFKLRRTGATWDSTPRQRIAWTKPGAKMGFLVLPLPDGVIENSDQLFGNWTTCEHGDPCANGFAALAFKCDSPLNHGNGDGICDKNDALWGQLRWLIGRPDDPNRKLLTMSDIGLVGIDVKHYLELEGQQVLTDKFGNQFSYQGTADFGWKNAGTGKVTDLEEIFDVFLLDERIAHRD